MIRAFLITILFLSNVGIVLSQSRDVDSVYQVKIDGFWSQLLSVDSLSCNIQTRPEYSYIPTQHTIFASCSQQVVKSKKQHYIEICQTGIVYQLQEVVDSALIFKRIDQTININYNIGANNFIYNNELFSYGGYGFWQTNGLLRKFNKVDKEWDIVPLNKEIILSDFTWFSEKEGRLYAPYQSYLNAGIIGQERPVKIMESYYLDIQQRKWIALGVLNNNLRELVEAENFSVIPLNTESGYLLLQHEVVYLFDFVHNKVWKSNNASLNQFLLRKSSDRIWFVFNNTIYSYNKSINSFVTFKYSMNDFDLMPYPIWSVNLKDYWYVVGSVFFIVLIIIVILLIKRNLKSKFQSAQLKMLKTKSIQQAFIGVELVLIELLLEAKLNNKTVEIAQINHVLGIKDKNIGLQKKVRSDVMNAINDKYQFITQGDIPLISSMRKEDDKRFFEYYITPTEVKTIQKIIITKE